jgi:hypothetical protein
MKDLEGIPKELRRKLTFLPVSHMREVLDLALAQEPNWRTDKPTSPPIPRSRPRSRSASVRPRS